MGRDGQASISEPPYAVWNAWKGFTVEPAGGVVDEDMEPFLSLLRLMVPDENTRGHCSIGSPICFSGRGEGAMGATLCQ